MIAFDKIEQNLVLSSWKDAIGNGKLSKGLSKEIKTPQYGVFIDKELP
ncbi:hypothetical protein ACMDB5_08945 [Flavobacterium sp. W1B]